jgi:hypothetical protein
MQCDILSGVACLFWSSRTKIGVFKESLLDADDDDDDDNKHSL